MYDTKLHLYMYYRSTSRAISLKGIRILATQWPDQITERVVGKPETPYCTQPHLVCNLHSFFDFAGPANHPGLVAIQSRESTEKARHAEVAQVAIALP